MRHVIALLIVCAVLSPLSSTNAKHGGTQDNCEPFGIELPELKTGFLPAPAHKEIPVPANPRLTRILIWIVPPYDSSVAYRANVMLNGQSLSPTTKGSGKYGNFLDIDLRRNPNLTWHADRNVLEVTAQEARNNISYRCSFVLLPGKTSAAQTLAEGCATEVRTETHLAPIDPHILQPDRTAPQLTLTAPTAAFNAATAVQSVVVSGSATDDSGFVRTITANGQVIASTPVPKDKRIKLPPLKKGDKAKPAATPPPLAFNTTLTITPSTRALQIEAEDLSGNRTRITVPILQPDCVDATVAQRQAALAATTTTGFSGRRYAVVVGVSEYEHHEGYLNNLKYARADAEAIRDWLRSPSGGGFKPNDIVCLTDSGATLAAVRQALRSFLTTAGENDLVYLFMAGHGAPDPLGKGELYFLLSDSKVTDLRNTALAMSEVGNFVNQQSKQARLIAFFDTCHSAGINRQALNTPAAATQSGGQDKRSVGTKPVKQDKPAAPPVTQPTNRPPTVKINIGAPAAQLGSNLYDEKLFQKKGWLVISSSGLNEESQEADHWGNGHGVFTWALLEGAQQGKADANGDCQITAAELFAYVKKTVSEQTGRAQNPQSLEGGRGDLEVARVPETACREKARK